MTINVDFNQWTAAGEDGPSQTVKAILTTDHASSSYGVPVLVINGNAYGSKDIPTPYYDLHISPADNGLSLTEVYKNADAQAAYTSLVDAARNAGYQLSESTYKWS